MYWNAVALVEGGCARPRFQIVFEKLDKPILFEADGCIDQPRPLATYDFSA